MTFETSFRRTAAAEPRPAAPVRLTRRGRVVLVLLALGLLFLAFGLGRATGADAGATVPLTRRTVVVQPGETLWQIARRAAPGADPRVTVGRIQRLNDLRDTVQPGQRLTLP